MGAITDSFFGFAAGILMIMDYALNHGISVAMMGQGLGPLEPGILRECARETLGRVPTIGLREAVFSVPLLESLGIGKDQYAITGDDAIEPAYESRPEHLGTAIGLCIRISEYSSLDVTTLHRIAAAVASFAESRHTDVLPVPIWFGPDSDLGYFNLIAAGHGRFVHGDASLEDHRQLLQQISRCRVVVTAAYHAAVFALSQGISVVAITGCAYYEQKFLGLAAMFEYGCTVIRVDSELERSVTSALSESWARAPEWRNSLLAHAQHQIHCGQKLYRDLASTNFAERAIQPSIVS
jgi:polysaccharide pyruvyl transferase WcaK-like protein